MKINWGWAVVITFCIFGVTMISLVVKMFQVPVNMVSKEYYSEEQLYEVKLKQKQNVKELSALPVLALNKEDGMVDVILPPELNKVEGSIRFFRPSDSRLDFNVKLALSNENEQKIDVSRIVRGRWILQLSFAEGDKKYFYEKPLVI
ncbi:hypothetical protein EI427_01040 [Flammeovirga pectinis]|uniref:Nitrogen fixation protein FixH n=1 Tax=Flammeovirga pectinis TaxID=2494373 RepID=A0A3Q9FLB9_9BACT|nr:FixH family protein [Flammeovirga pectinis]AZQ60845.1 hypothetical protein EI427_01040 [Flammeovirga pectinis]